MRKRERETGNNRSTIVREGGEEKETSDNVRRLSIVEC